MRVPAGEGVRALEVEPVALLDVALAVAPLVDTIFKVWGEDLHGCTKHHHQDKSTNALRTTHHR